MIKFLIIVTILFFFFKRFGGWILRMLLKAFLGNQAKKFQQAQTNGFNRTQQEKETKKEGEITINHVPEKEKNKFNFKGGDYVDFEELKK